MNTIEESAFAHADGLTNIRIPGNIKAIEDGAFYGCKNLTSITIENGLGNIGSSVFMNVKSRKNCFTRKCQFHRRVLFQWL